MLEGASLPVERIEDYFVGRFTAMASPCEVLIDTDDEVAAEHLCQVAEAEAKRVERKFSRYRTDSVVHAIHAAAGRPIALDGETASLVDYAATCHRVSGGRFDITSGALRRVWTFDGGSRVPTSEAVSEALRFVGWHRVSWTSPELTLPAGMEIDFGGLAKEYAVDRAAALLAARTDRPYVVNLGGDLFARGGRRGGRPWGVGVDDPDRTGKAASYRVELLGGGLATSGDARRYVMWKGKRLGHILDPRTGWPVEGAPRAVTVFAPSCLEAGTLSTFAYLEGPNARRFLEDQGVNFLIL